MTSATAAVPVPDHVPEDLVVDFDCFNVDGIEDDMQLAWLQVALAPGKDLFWTPRNGGHWVLTRGEELFKAQGDYERFSNENYMIPRTERKIRPLPLGVDPPDHRKYRALIAPAFSPKAVREASEEVREVTRELIAELAPRGQCEFVGAFAKILPVVVFLGIAGLPQEERPTAVALAERFIRAQEIEDRTEGLEQIAAYLKGWIEKRRADPQDDLISKIVHANVDGRPITDEEAYGLLIILFNGGLDTVAGQLTYAFRFLAIHPGHRRELTEDPSLVPVAVEEMLRRHSMIAIGRQVAGDTELCGVTLKAGDMLQIPTMLCSLSEEMIERPLEVDFHRPTPIPLATFGNGPHKCPGSNLARQELRIAIEEWLPVIPNFEVVQGAPLHPASGMVSVLRSLHLRWPAA